MALVLLALKKPYTFIVAALLILVFGILSILFQPKDIFPSIDIPVVSVIWSYAGLPADEFEERITSYGEYALSDNINDIERIESQTIDGISIIKLFFHQGVNISEAIAQATASSQTVLKKMPPGTLPPHIMRYDASTVPLIQMLLSSKDVSLTEIYDYANYRIRQDFASIEGITLPNPYGGNIREIMVDVIPEAMLARGLSARNINEAILNQVVTLPIGDARIGDIDYRVNVNNVPIEPSLINDMPVARVDNKIIYVKDVAFAHDGFAPITNTVMTEGKESVSLKILKHGPTSSLYIVDSIKDMLDTIRQSAPKGINIDLFFDQSLFIKKAINNVVEELITASFLIGLLVLLFLRSIRSTLIVLVSIPLSILTSIICLNLLDESLNIMTLGGLALSIGILVDNATVTVENIHRNFIETKNLKESIIEGSRQVAIPSFISTLTICIVFIPVMILKGVSKYLFTPFALSVVFAVFASYLISRTLVPILIKYFHNPANYSEESAFNRFFEKFKHYYSEALKKALDARKTLLAIFALFFFISFLLFPFIGSNYFPIVDAHQILIHARVKPSTRIEITTLKFMEIEQEIKKLIEHDDLKNIMLNIGIPSSVNNLTFGDGTAISIADGDILISLDEHSNQSTSFYKKLLQEHLTKKFPEYIIFFPPSDIISQILNFGLPTPIDIKFIGHDKKGNLELAKKMVNELQTIKGIEDSHIHQIYEEPELFISVDRTLLAKIGLTQKDVMNDITLTVGDSTVTSSNFWLDRSKGRPYPISVQLPKYRINNIQDLMNTPISNKYTSQSELLGNLASIERKVGVGTCSHYNIKPVFDVYASTSGRDLGSVSQDIQKLVKKMTPQLKPGNNILVDGLIKRMDETFFILFLGFLLSLVLVYFLLVVNFQSWLEPFIIISAIPGAICGVIWILFLTDNTFNIPSLMGSIMCIGIVTANSILLVTFANEKLQEGKTSIEAAFLAAKTRLRPILMTALAMIIGMLPMALAIGEGGSQNAPLGTAVIGGLIVATFTTLFFVPAVFCALCKKPNPIERIDQ
jgi:multidrug efflux pump subunit AcrB